MAKEVCVFCGESFGPMRMDYLNCGPVHQWACKPCAKKMEPADPVERCREAMKLGLAAAANKMAEFLAMAENAEKSRPVCLRCGEKMKFGPVVDLDDNPNGIMKNSILFSSSLSLRPLYCTACGKIEFYNPGYLCNNEMLTYLAKQDTGEI